MPKWYEKFLKNGKLTNDSLKENNDLKNELYQYVQFLSQKLDNYEDNIKMVESTISNIDIKPDEDVSHLIRIHESFNNEYTMTLQEILNVYELLSEMEPQQPTKSDEDALLDSFEVIPSNLEQLLSQQTGLRDIIRETEGEIAKLERGSGKEPLAVMIELKRNLREMLKELLKVTGEIDRIMEPNRVRNIRFYERGERPDVDRINDLKEDIKTLERDQYFDEGGPSR